MHTPLTAPRHAHRATALALLLAAASAVADPPACLPTDRSDHGLPHVASVLAGLADADTPGATAAHRAELDARFARIRTRLLAPLGDFATAELPGVDGGLYYPFSGPDLLYPLALFPDVERIVLTGLEPVGEVPVLDLPPVELEKALAELRASIQNLLRASFFVTAEMQRQFRRHRWQGTTPVLLLFLARAGVEVEQASPFEIDESGQACAGGIGGIPGISLAGRRDGRRLEVSYVQMDLSNGGLAARPGYLAWLERQQVRAAFVKSASFLMHGGDFSRVRERLLALPLLVQDDSGIPLRFFDPARHQLRCVGRYPGAPQSFPGTTQPALQALCRDNPPLPFWFGYRYGGHDSHVLIARRQQ